MADIPEIYDIHVKAVYVHHQIYPIVHSQDQNMHTQLYYYKSHILSATNIVLPWAALHLQ